MASDLVSISGTDFWVRYGAPAPVQFISMPLFRGDPGRPDKRRRFPG
jgi:hypothetical protein